MTMTSLQALVTGMIAGSLVGRDDAILIDVEIITDENGYTNEILVTGRESKEQLLVTVTTVDKEVSAMVDRIKEYSS